MAYTKNPTWQDYDGTDDTLITAAKLNHLEEGVEAAAAAADAALAGGGVGTIWSGSQAANEPGPTPRPATPYFRPLIPTRPAHQRSKVGLRGAT